MTIEPLNPPPLAPPQDGADEELVPAEVSEELLQSLLGMDFPRNRAVRSLHGSGNSSVEGAINWLADHEGDDDLDEPLMVKKVSGWSVLTELWGLG